MPKLFSSTLKEVKRFKTVNILQKSVSYKSKIKLKIFVGQNVIMIDV